MVGGETLLPKILGQPTLVRAKSPILNRYSLVSPQPQAATSSEKVRLTLIGSPRRAFQ